MAKPESEPTLIPDQPILQNGSDLDTFQHQREINMPIADLLDITSIRTPIKLSGVGRATTDAVSWD